ncbi:TrbG/VirB9 family P-type conjugative transfer protein (plasmid) [Cupriavidus basilensis]
MKRRLLTILLGAAVCVPTAYAKPQASAPAEEKLSAAALPIEVPDESRIVMFTYSPDAIFRVLTTPGTITHLELEAGEGIVETPAIGDSIQWRVSGGPRNLYLKPLRPNLTTTLTVVTDKRTYQLELRSGEPGAKRFQKVTFHYPDEEAALTLKERDKVEAVVADKARLKSQELGGAPDPTAYVFDYDLEGDAPFKPITVFNDGRQTFLRLPTVQDQPGVFLYEDDKPSLVNYVVKGDYVIVDRVANKLLLKLGKREVRVTRKTSRWSWGN